MQLPELITKDSSLTVVSMMRLSGTTTMVGTHSDHLETTLVMWNDEYGVDEVTYFSVSEAKMLIAALQACVAQAEGEL